MPQHATGRLVSVALAAAILAAAPIPGYAFLNRLKDLSEQVLAPFSSSAVGQTRESLAGWLEVKSRRLPSLSPLYEALYRDAEWNAVLNFNQIGLAALELGDREVAEKAFEQAIVRIETIYADDPEARAALSVFAKEEVKDFKGEPHERAMSYFYRGLLYASRAEFDNARAAFLAGDFQDTMSESERYDGDFGMFKYMAAWASMCDGDMSRAADLAADARKADPSLSGFDALPPRGVVLIESGTAPTKLQRGRHKEFLSFGDGEPPHAQITLGDVTNTFSAADFQPIADLGYQATTRGGRAIDSVLSGKAQFKDTTQAVAETATGLGIAVTIAAASSPRGVRNDNTAAAGLLIAIAGMVGEGIAASMTPEADIRWWSSLPAKIYFKALPYHPMLQLTFQSEAMAEPAPFPLAFSAKGCQLAWGRTHSALPVGSVANSGARGTAQIQSRSRPDGGRMERNVLFRNWLLTEF